MPSYYIHANFHYIVAMNEPFGYIQILHFNKYIFTTFEIEIVFQNTFEIRIQDIFLWRKHSKFKNYHHVMARKSQSHKCF